MGISQLGGLLDVFNQVGPGRGKPLVGLRLSSTLHKRFNDPCSSDLFAASVEDFLLKLSNQSISLIAELDRDLRHHTMNRLSHL